LSPREAAHHPWNAEREVFALEPVIQPNPAPRFSTTPGSIGESPSVDSASEGLRRWGLSDEDVESLRHRGAIN
jgi:alpha-methylacyl-CoA racemase